MGDVLKKLNALAGKDIFKTAATLAVDDIAPRIRQMLAEQYRRSDLDVETGRLMQMAVKDVQIRARWRRKGLVLSITYPPGLSRGQYMRFNRHRRESKPFFSLQARAAEAHALFMSAFAARVKQAINRE